MVINYYIIINQILLKIRFENVFLVTKKIHFLQCLKKLLYNDEENRLFLQNHYFLYLSKQLDVTLRD